MICNSGLLLSKKLKDFVSGNSGGEKSNNLPKKRVASLLLSSQSSSLIEPLPSSSHARDVIASPPSLKLRNVKRPGTVTTEESHSDSPISDILRDAASCSSISYTESLPSTSRGASEVEKWLSNSSTLYDGEGSLTSDGELPQDVLRPRLATFSNDSSLHDRLLIRHSDHKIDQNFASSHFTAKLTRRLGRFGNSPPLSSSHRMCEVEVSVKSGGKVEHKIKYAESKNSLDCSKDDLEKRGKRLLNRQEMPPSKFEKKCLSTPDMLHNPQHIKKTKKKVCTEMGSFHHFQKVSQSVLKDVSPSLNSNNGIQNVCHSLDYIYQGKDIEKRDEKKFDTDTKKRSYFPKFGRKYCNNIQGKNESHSKIGNLSITLRKKSLMKNHKSCYSDGQRMGGRKDENSQLGVTSHTRHLSPVYLDTPPCDSIRRCPPRKYYYGDVNIYQNALNVVEVPGTRDKVEEDLSYSREKQSLCDAAPASSSATNRNEPICDRHSKNDPHNGVIQLPSTISSTAHKPKEQTTNSAKKIHKKLIIKEAPSVSDFDHESGKSESHYDVHNNFHSVHLENEGKSSRDPGFRFSTSGPKSTVSNSKFPDRPVPLGHHSSTRVRNAKLPLATWEPQFTVLMQDEATLTTYRSEDMALTDGSFFDLPRVRLDGGSRAFRKRWGYELGPQHPTLMEEDDEGGDAFPCRPLGEDDPYSQPFDGDGDNLSFAETRSLRDYSYSQDTSYEKACGQDRRGSAPATPILGGRGHHPPNQSPLRGEPHTPTQSRFANFFSKRSIKNLPLKRTKSVTKLERNKRGGILASNHSIQSARSHQQASHHLSNTNITSQVVSSPANSPASRLRSSQSHESLLASHNHQMMSTLDLAAGEAVIKTLHESILGQKFCFQISSPSGVRYFSCRSAEERDKWVESLRRAVNPNADHKCRVHNAIKINIVEAKHIQPKKKYFCELHLDGALYARTSCKHKQELCFWGENFEFKNLPSVQTISIALYREGEKRRKKDKHTLIGKVNIPSANVTTRSVVEKWYPVEDPLNNNNNKNSSRSTNSKESTPSLRIKCSFQTVHILPLELYNDFHQFVRSNYSGICGLLEPVVNVSTKSDIATTLVHLTQHSQSATALITDIVVAEINKNDDAHLIFRGNSVATKAMEAFMKLVGERYLHDTLQPAIDKILEDNIDCEVDPKKLSNESLIPKHQQNLISIVKNTWARIIQSPAAFPPELRQCFVLFRERLLSMNKESLSDKLISASIFLRFLCPAILNPSLFNITQELPNEKATRNLTLVAKTLQTLVNFTKFQGKEQYMEFMNEFIEEEQEQMKCFLRRISTRSNCDQRSLEYAGEIDLGVQLSVLQTLLTECLPSMKPTTSQEHYYKDTLQKLINELETAKANPNNDLVHSLASQGSNSTNSSMSNSTMIEHHKLDERRQRLQPLTQNIFTYNDPTALGSYSSYQNAYNHHDTSNNNSMNSYNDFNPNTKQYNGQTSVNPESPRSCTLPRNQPVPTFRKPAMDLQTDDDYVHFSALPQNNSPQKMPHPVTHSFSQNDVPTGSSTPLHNHHRHFGNHMMRYYQPNGNYSHSPSSMSPQQCAHVGNPDDMLNSSNDYDQNLSADCGDIGNMKGSHTSISQLSNNASSGYQSFAYSQSSSPVDPVITNNDMTNNNQKNTSMGGGLNNNNPNIAQMPQITHITQPSPQVAALAFNNPMYHLDSGSPRSNNSKMHPSQVMPHHFLVNGPHSRPYPLNHSQSSHSTVGFNSNQYSGHHCSSSLSSAQSVEDLVMGSVKGSDDSGSMISSTSTPPPIISTANDAKNYLDNKNKKSTAPRTNPRVLPSNKTPSWSQNPSNELHSSVTNIPSSYNINNNPKVGNNYELHHSASDLLTYSQNKRGPRSHRRQSAEFAPSRQWQIRMNSNYESTSDDTSSDENNVRKRASRTTPSNGKVSDYESIEKCEDEIHNLRRILNDMQMELKDKQKISSSSAGSHNSSSSPISSATSSNTPPSPAPTSPSISGFVPTDDSPSTAGMKSVLQRGESLKKFGEAGSMERRRPKPGSYPRGNFNSKGGVETQKSVTAEGKNGTQVKDLLSTIVSLQSQRDDILMKQQQQISSLDHTNNKLIDTYQQLMQQINNMDLSKIDADTSDALATISNGGNSIVKPTNGSSQC